MHNWKWLGSDKKQYLPYVPICFSPFRCRFAGPLQFSSSTVKHTKLYQSNFRDVFQFFTRKLFEKNCLLVEFKVDRLQIILVAKKYISLPCLCHECLPSNSLSEGAASCERLKKAGILARNSHTSLASDWTYHFFTRAKHHSLFWLVKTHLCKKIYDIAFWWVYLGRHLKSVILYVRVCVHVWMGVVYAFICKFCSIYCTLSCNLTRSIKIKKISLWSVPGQ